MMMTNDRVRSSYASPCRTKQKKFLPRLGLSIRPPPATRMFGISIRQLVLETEAPNLSTASTKDGMSDPLMSRWPSEVPQRLGQCVSLAIGSKSITLHHVVNINRVVIHYADPAPTIQGYNEREKKFEGIDRCLLAYACVQPRGSDGVLRDMHSSRIQEVISSEQYSKDLFSGFCPLESTNLSSGTPLPLPAFRLPVAHFKPSRH
jgi:hypothetical protein